MPALIFPTQPLMETTAATFKRLTFESKDQRRLRAGHSVLFDHPKKFTFSSAANQQAEGDGDGRWQLSHHLQCLPHLINVHVDVFQGRRDASMP